MAATRDIKEKRELGRLKFTSNANLTAKELAKMLDVTEKTLSKWRKDDMWDDQREANNTQPLLLIKKYQRAMQVINDKLEKEGRTEFTNAELDSLTKLNKLVETLTKRNTPQQVMEVMNEFNLYMADKDVKLAQLIVEHTDAYVTKKIKESK